MAATTGGATPNDKTLDAAQAISVELARVEPKLRFTDGAVSELETAYAEYSRAIGIDATRTARRDGMSVVDAQHIRRSVQRLDQGQGGGGWLTLLGNTLGSILAGAGISLTLTLLTSEADYSVAAMLVGNALSAVGLLMLAVAVTATIRRT